MIPHSAGTHPRDAAWCLLGAFVLYVPGIFPVFPPVGDAADYASLIAHGVFDVRASHVGYYVFAYPFVTVGQWLGVSPTIVLNGLAAACMSVAVACANLFMQELALGRRAAVIGAAVLATSGFYWYHALFGELQALLVMLVFASFWLFLAGAPVIAGVVYGCALLVTQAAAPSAVVFPLLALRQGGLRAFLRCTAAGAAAFALGVVPVAREYFFGTRGVMPSLDYYQAASPVKMVLLFSYRVLENHLLAVPLIGVGLVWVWRYDRRLLALVAALWVGHAWVGLRLGHIEYGFSWMPFVLASAALAGVGASWVMDRAPRAGGTAVALSGLASVALTWTLYVAPKRQDAMIFAIVVDSVGTLAGTDSVVAWPHEGFVYVNRRFPQTADVWLSSWQQAPTVDTAWLALAARPRGRWLLIHDVPTNPLRRWLFSNALASRLLPADARAQYMSEGSTEGEEVLAQLPAGVTRLVASWPASRLYHLGREAASAAPPH